MLNAQMNDLLMIRKHRDFMPFFRREEVKGTFLFWEKSERVKVNDVYDEVK